MPRPPRIEYEKAWYHVMNRGVNHCKIFLASTHYKVFLGLLWEITDLFAAEIHAYCLMGNHYHLLICTPKGNLSEIMKQLDGVYAKRFNKLTERDGHLFRGRYKAILIDKDPYLLQVSRYIHLNPGGGHNLEIAKNYKWSSCKAYLNIDKPADWLFTDEILEQVGGHNEYHQFISCDVDETTLKTYSRKSWPSILGNKKFKALCKKRTFS